MDFFLILLILLILKDIKFCVKGNPDYLSKSQSNAIKGIFILFVLFRHFTQYTTDFAGLDQRIMFVNYYFDQLIVVMFLFYSGYGVYYSIKNKGMDYVKKLPIRRILPVLVQFMAIVCIYYGVSLWLGMNYSIKRLLVSLIGWRGVGNSNWYIFGIIILYLITYIAAQLAKENSLLFFVISFIGIVGLIVILCQFKEAYWYNTLFAYYFGMFFLHFEKNITKSFKNHFIYIVSFIICFVLYYITRTHSSRLVCYEFMSVFFAMLVVMITMKVKIGNRYLCFLGENLFPLYMLQRLPMMLLQKYSISTNTVVYFLYVTTATILLAVFYTKIMDYVSNAVSGWKKSTKRTLDK